MSALASAACGTSTPRAGGSDLVDATPRALAAVVAGHVGAQSGAPRRATGEWSDWGDPLAIEAQVDYGVDPEGTEDGETRTVRIRVEERDHPDADADEPRCRADDERCEESKAPDGRTVLYHWSTGSEEEAGTYFWTVVGEEEVVNVGYEGSGLFAEDPRGLDVPVDPSDLRAAAVDPALSLHTTGGALAAGEELDVFEGEEERPEEPEVVPTTPDQLAERVAHYVGTMPAAVRPSRLRELGADAVGVHMRFEGTARHDPFTVDVLTTAGRAPQVDRPCPERRRDVTCSPFDDDIAVEWDLGDGDRPGRMWIFGAQEDDRFNRVETVAVLVVTVALDHPPFEPRAPLRLPDLLLSDLAWMTGDLSLGPEQRVE